MAMKLLMMLVLSSIFVMGQAQHGAGHFSGSGIFTGFNSEGGPTYIGIPVEYETPDYGLVGPTVEQEMNAYYSDNNEYYVHNDDDVYYYENNEYNFDYAVY